MFRISSLKALVHTNYKMRPPKTSEPIPSTIQPPLFDHTETALSVLTWLENLSLHQLLT